MVMLLKLTLMGLFVPPLIQLVWELCFEIGVVPFCMPRRTYESDASSALFAKFLATCLALSTAHDLGLKRVILEDDSLEVITLLSDPSGENPPWVINGIIQDCFNLIKSFDQVSCSHVRRYANSVAQSLANHGQCSKLLEMWSSDPPS